MERAAETDASTETETEHPLMRRRPSTPDADETVDLVAAARVAANVVVDDRAAAAVAAEYASFESAYVASSVSDDDACVSLAGEGLRTFPPGVDPATRTTLADRTSKTVPRVG